MKKRRHEALLRIIETHTVSTQTELLEFLQAEGIDATQATISRDIKDLRLVKKSDASGKSRYTVDNNENGNISEKYRSVFRHSVISADFAGHLLVIKCYSGMAQAACAALDAMQLEGSVGTIAGDDTIFVACRSEEFASKMTKTIAEIIA